jgi:hypothetical protein
MTRVIFRKWKDNGDIIAFFPDDDWGRGLIGSYMHTGQHGGAMYPCDTVPASPEEYADLLAELKQVGYDDLVIRKRRTR